MKTILSHTSIYFTTSEGYVYTVTFRSNENTKHSGISNYEIYENGVLCVRSKTTGNQSNTTALRLLKNMLDSNK